MTYSGTNTYFGNQDLMEIVRRKPEAVLLVAAGCALLMRSGRRPVDSIASRMSKRDYARVEQAPNRSTASGIRAGISRAGDAISATAASATETVSDTASDVQGRVSDAASRVTDTLADYAEGARQNIADSSDRLMRQAQSSYQSTAAALREQPILVAALGLAAGAAVAALFPATDLERRTLGAARDNIADAASKLSENLVSAADAATQKLNEAATERGLNTEGIKDMAREVAGAFTSAAAGKRDERGPGSANAQSAANSWQSVSTIPLEPSTGRQSFRSGTGNDNKS